MNTFRHVGGRWVSTAFAALLLSSVVAAPVRADEAAGSGSASGAVVNPKYEIPARIRGAKMNLSHATPEVINRAADYGINFFAYTIRPDHRKALEPRPTPENPLIPYQEGIEHLRELLPVLESRGLKISIAVVPWGRSQDIFWQEEKGNHYREHLPRFWTAFAKEFKDEPTIAVYEVMTEPNYKEGNAATWQEELLPRAVEAIRAVNSKVWLMVQPGPWGLTAGFKTLKPLDDPYVIYAFHMYAPHTYTHQGIGKNKAAKGKRTYPGMLKQFPGRPRIMWDKAQLKEFMEPALDFARENDARMFCTEFGVVRWAPGAGQWAEDVISIFEEYGFDWCAFSLAGWNGWNPTFPADAPAKRANYGGLDHSPVLDAWRAGWALNEQADESSSAAAK